MLGRAVHIDIRRYEILLIARYVLRLTLRYSHSLRRAARWLEPKQLHIDIRRYEM